ncbi:MAG: GIY-YIG nuclease family protein [Pyrinomonadaceae bacterium]|nr:GIY-YIG nuclease family protein [Pyrinomonadaceae bacterium]
MNEKVYVDSSLNVPGKINRHKFQLNAGVHPSKQLQSDWSEFGETAFEFETLEPVEPRDDKNYDYAADLETLEDLWIEKLSPFGEHGYNEPKKTRDERLRMIASNRNL